MAYPGLALYKLMILYMLQKVTFPLSNSQLVDFLLNRNYTDYFHAQEAINDLLSDRHILSETQGNTTRYEITEEGSKTLGYLEGMISPEIRSEILDYLRENSFTLRSESGIRSEYRVTPQREYAVHCMIIEGGSPLFDMTVNVMSREEAERMCRAWEDACQDVYMTVMRKLLGDGGEPQ